MPGRRQRVFEFAARERNLAGEQRQTEGPPPAVKDGVPHGAVEAAETARDDAVLAIELKNRWHLSVSVDAA